MGLFDMFKKQEKQNVTTTIPKGKVLYTFRALEDFWSDQFRSQYVAGGRYYVREGNDKLAVAVTDWIRQGKVEV